MHYEKKHKGYVSIHQTVTELCAEIHFEKQTG